MTAELIAPNSGLPPETPAEVYQALMRSLRRKQGFGLFFVQCSKAQGNNIAKQLLADLPQKKIQVLQLDQPVETLFDQIEARHQQEPIDILLIQGLEVSLYAYEDTKRLSGWGSKELYAYSWQGVPPILIHLNRQRERFRDSFQFSLVFLVPGFVIDYFIQRAPDFFDWRSGLFKFPMDFDNLERQSLAILQEGDYQAYCQLTVPERNQKLLEIKGLLHEPGQSASQKAALLFEQGNLLAAANNYIEAIASYDKAIEIKPDHHQAWTVRGLALDDLGRTEDAIASYDKAIEIKPDHHQAWTVRGLTLAILGRAEDAIASYDKAIEIKPDHHQAWTVRGLTLAILGRAEDAITSYDKAIEIKPDLHEAWTARGVALDNLGRAEDAITSYDKAIEIKPDLHEAWTARGVALDNLGRTEDAIASYDKAIAIKPDYHQAWYNRGVDLANLGRTEDAIASYDKAIEIKPDYHEAWFNRGNALANLGRTEDAIASYDKAIEIKPDEANAFYNKACCLAKQGEVDLAIEALRRAIELSPDKYRELAKTDTDFDSIRDDEQFQRLLAGTEEA